jgi:glycosyltransferase involved in cell wall biosynthesis
MSIDMGAHGHARTGSARNRTAPEISVVIPARNEAANLPAVISRLPRNIFEVILVDGHSTDDTIDVARKLLPDVRALRQQGRGKGDALAMGFAAARGDIIVMLDADGSADAAEIPRFVAALVAGADFVKGSRFAQGGGSSDITTARRLGNRALCTLVNRAYGMVYTDLCYGYNAFWADCLPLLQKAWPGSSVPPAAQAPYGSGFEIETMLNVRAAKAALTVWEVPSFERPRISGQSNLSAIRDGMRILRAIWQESPGRALRRDRAALAEMQRSFASLAPASPAGPQFPHGASEAADTREPVIDGSVLDGEDFREILPERVTLNGHRHAPAIPHTLNGHGPATHPALNGQTP